VFCDKRLIELPVPGKDTDFDGDLQPIFEQFTAHYAATDEIHDEAEFEKSVSEENRVAARGIEVGHIFFFGDKYSEPMKAAVAGSDGKDILMQMGSYGVGVSRLVGGLIEAFHDDDGCKWPMAVAPFHVGLVNLKAGDEATDAACAKIYRALEDAGVEVLYDDTGARPGEKFARMDLIGLPYQIVIGPRGLKDGNAEIKHRVDGDRSEVAIDNAASHVSKLVHDALIYD